jgi:hypothetical protein
MPIDKRLLKSESLIWMINCKRLRVLSLKKGNDVVWRVVRRNSFTKQETRRK